ncbi:hypothetical protein FSP39_022488 [Pinctada imbricata]|uniref:Uncharacterized protein n=1 Tax=Pinctada imbricata TaxID=66713 RepID=A0AA89BY53_PINIB|nr:hypothetical protein FSP39_022488 [Pinctada imbricata]
MENVTVIWRLNVMRIQSVAVLKAHIPTVIHHIVIVTFVVVSKILIVPVTPEHMVIVTRTEIVIVIRTLVVMMILNVRVPRENMDTVIPLDNVTVIHMTVDVTMMMTVPVPPEHTDIVTPRRIVTVILTLVVMTILNVNVPRENMDIVTSNGKCFCHSHPGCDDDSECTCPPGEHGHCDSNGKCFCHSHPGCDDDSECTCPLGEHGHCDSNGKCFCHSHKRRIELSDRQHFRGVWRKVFQQIVGIPMGTNCAPLLADIFLYSYEAEFIQSLVSEGKSYLDSDFNFTYRYIDDVLSINNPKFADNLSSIYPSEFEVKETTETNNSAFYLDIMLSYDTDGHMNTSLYEKRDDFNFSITNFPFLSSNSPSSPAYGVFISQLMRYARASTKYTDFVLRARRLSDKLQSQGYVCDRLTSSLRKRREVISNKTPLQHQKQNTKTPDAKTQKTSTARDGKETHDM